MHNVQLGIGSSNWNVTTCSLKLFAHCILHGLFLYGLLWYSKQTYMIS